MKLTSLFTAVVTSLLLFTGRGAAADDNQYKPKMASCQMAYNLKGWSVVVSSKQGIGTITCDNGQKAEVTLRAIGGGFTVGKSEIIGGVGKFSEVRSIDEIYGTYAQADAHAGAAKSAEFSALTKGEISFYLRGTGRGMDIGVSFGGLTISRR